MNFKFFVRSSEFKFSFKQLQSHGTYIKNFCKISCITGPQIPIGDKIIVFFFNSNIIN